MQSRKTLKEALMLTTGDSYRQSAQQFFELGKESGESLQVYGRKLYRLYDRMTKDTLSLKEMKEKVVLERMLSILPYKCQSSVREKQPKTLTKACQEADLWFASNRYRSWKVERFWREEELEEWTTEL